jgi:hypothetical protein
MIMQANEVVGQAIAVLGPIAAGGANVAQGVATRVLGDMVAERLRGDGHASAWEEFQHNPRNDSLVRHLLQQAVVQDASFRSRLDEAVRAAASARPRNSGQQTINITGSGAAQIGDRGDTIEDSRVATRGGTYHEGDIHNEGDRVTHKKSNAGGFVALAVVALVVIGLAVLLIRGAAGALHKAHDNGLTATSTCEQFLNIDESTEQQALVDIAISKGIGGFGSPLALPEIRYECSSAPTMTLGAIVERDKGEY